MRVYHDEEWGQPQLDDNRLFEMLVLESAQAGVRIPRPRASISTTSSLTGLSWSTILAKREGYRSAFGNFDIAHVAAFGNFGSSFSCPML
jgi:DNA-3-methyladenine glycosylase I